MNLKKIRKDESGATAVVVALMLVVLIGIVALVIDLGRGYTLKAQMQSACDLASIAGANVLAKNTSDTTKAHDIAEDIAAKNGFDKKDVSVEIIDGTKVRVKINKTQENYFAAVIGFKTSDVACSATAGTNAVPGKTKKIHPFFEYLLFHSGTSGELKLRAGVECYGSIHSNADINADSATIVGNVSVKGTLKGSNGYIVKAPVDKEHDIYQEVGRTEMCWWDQNLPGYMGYVYTPSGGKKVKIADSDVYVKTDDIIQVPSFIKDSAMDIIPTDDKGNPKMPVPSNPALKGSINGGTSQTINGDVLINGNGNLKCDTGMLTINGNVYCNGDLNLQRVTINGNVFCTGHISSSGENITFKGDYIYANSIKLGNGMSVAGIVVTNNDFTTNGNMNQLDGGVAVLSLNGDINLTSGGQGLDGIVYAPNGKVSFGGTTTVHGSIIAKSIDTNSKLYVYPMKDSTATDLGEIVTGGGTTTSPTAGSTVLLLE